MHGGAGRRHLHLDQDQPQLLHRACAADPTITDESRRLAPGLIVDMVERVLQRAADRVVILGGDEDVAVEFADLGGPALGDVVLDRRVGGRHRRLEQRHRIIAQVDNLIVGIAASLGELEYPFRRSVGKAGFAGGGEDDADTGLAHVCCS